MAQQDFLEELRVEFSCPVCLDWLTDLVTLDCGHHCCASCLQQCWQDLLNILPCPVCQHHCAHRELQKNSQLSALADMVKQLPSSGSKRKQQLEQEQPLSEQHQQVLSLFCEQDLQLVCAQCRVSCEQQGHRVTSSEEAAAHHRKKFKSLLQTLKKQLKHTEMELKNQLEKIQELKEKVKTEKSLVLQEFQSHRRFLTDYEHVLESKLHQENTSVSQKITEHRNQMSAYASKARDLLSEITETCSQSDLVLLLSMRTIKPQLSSDNVLKAPKDFSHTFKELSPKLPPHHFGRPKMAWFYTDLTLDPKTAHHGFNISEDQKKAIFSYDMIDHGCAPNPTAFTSHPDALSSEGFEAGRHFWTVEIRGIGAFAVGVCKESFPRDIFGSWSSEEGCWKFKLGTPPVSDGIMIHIGVFLDYELGEISFFDMRKRCLLYSKKCTFTERLLAYFSVDSPTFSLTMSLVKS